MMNISTLMGATAPLAETGLQSTTPTADGSEAGQFNHLLESILSEVEGQEQQDEDITQSATWLGTLLHVFSQYSFGSIPTPDSSGEASLPTETGLSVSLTELMTALQTMTNQDGAAELQSLTPDDLGFLIESENNSNIDEILTIVRDTTGEAVDPAALSGLQSLLNGSLPANSTGVSQAVAPTQTPAGSSAQPMAGFVELAEELSLNSAKTVESPQSPAGSTAGSLPLADDAVETAFETLVTKTEPSLKATIPAKTEPTPETAVSTPTPASPTASSLNAGHQNSGTVLPVAVEAATDAPFQPQPKVQAKPEGPVPADQPVAPAPTPVTAVVDGKTVEGPKLPNIPALQQIVDTVELINNRGETSVRLQLHPESLGRVTIHLQTTNGDVVVRVLTETAQAQTLIRDHLPELKAAFATQGLQLNDLTVEVGSDSSAFDRSGQGSNGRLFEGDDEPPFAPLKKAPASVDPVRSQWSPGRGLNSINYQV